MIDINNQVFIKYAWITLLGCLFFLDVFCLLNSDFYQPKSIELRFKNNVFSSISLFQNPFYRVTKPIVVGENFTVKFDNL